jgi:hypothetical protein
MMGGSIFIDFHLRHGPCSYKFVDCNQLDFGLDPLEVRDGKLSAALRAIREKARPGVVNMIFEWELADGDNLPEIAMMIIEQVCAAFSYAEINVTSVRLPKFESVSAIRWIMRLPSLVRQTIMHTFIVNGADNSKCVIQHSGPELIKMKSNL